MIHIKNKKVLISLGGTFEPIDSVRGITNKSSGKMGLALAKQAYIQGADVTLIAADVSVQFSPLFNVVRVESAGQMADAIFERIGDFDIFISTAAVSDFKVINKYDGKISSDSSFDVNLKPALKIIREIKNINPDVFMVGFKAEFDMSYDELVWSARKQIADYGSDLVVVNDVSKEYSTFGSETNEVLVVDSVGVVSLSLSAKDVIAKKIIKIISKNIHCI